MKIKYYFMSVIMVAAALPGFTSCSDDDDDVIPSTELQLPDESIRVRIGDEYRVPVATIPIAGAGNYSAYSLTPEVCDIETDEDGVMYVAGYKNGMGSIVLADGNGTYKRVAVAVYTTDEMQLNYKTLRLTTQLNQLNRVNAVAVVAGNGGYKATVSDERIEAGINYETGVMSIVAAAEAEPYTGIVTVTDQTGLTTELTVEVSESTDRVKIGADTRVELPIDPSLGEYTVECLTPQYGEIVEADGKVYLEGKANGVAYVNISQGDLLRQQTYVIYTTDVLTLNETSLRFEMPLGRRYTSTDCHVVLGNGGYSVTSNNSNVSATINNTTGILTITALARINTYSAVLTVTDCTGLKASVTVSITCTFDPFTDTEIQSLLNAYESMISYRDNHPWFFDMSEKAMFTRTSDGIVSTGWEEEGWDGYNAFYVTYPDGTGLNEEVDGQLIIQEWGEEVIDGKVKIIADNAERFVALFYKIDEQREIIYSGYVVWVK